ncbi:MAG TPA: hypothetical protein VFQ53_13550 [Kofleriaceae bacterium]|nr:hypothetical protein [Kofleriaceae bacterium]
MGLMACGGGKDKPPVLIDSGSGSDGAAGVCNPLTQTGCNAGEKCTWIVDQDTPTEIGHIGCTPDGTVAVGGACTVGPAGPQGFDDCVKGSVCVAAECKTICDPQMVGTASGCDAQHSCSRYSGLFDMGGTTVAGACDPTCDPLDQNLLAGAGATAACGSTNPSMPNKGCYTFDFNSFSCAPVGMSTLTKTDRVEPVLSPSGNPFVNGCAPGYVPFFFESSTSMKVLCTGLCASDNISNVAAEKANDTGVDARTAKLVTSPAPAVGDGLCVAGKKGSTSGGTENCVMLWSFLTDANGNPGPSPYNETVGVCFAFTQFMYDSNGDMTPDKTFPNCNTLPKRSAATTGQDDDAADFGCQKIAESQFDGKAVAPMMKDFRMGFGPGEATAHIVK